METSRILTPTEAGLAELESRLSTLRVVAGGVVGAAAHPVDPDDEIRHKALEFLTAAKRRIAAAEQRAFEVEASRRQREAELSARIDQLETDRLQVQEENARLAAEKDAAEHRADRAEGKANSASEFLLRLNESLRDLAG